MDFIHYRGISTVGSISMKNGVKIGRFKSIDPLVRSIIPSAG